MLTIDQIDVSMTFNIEKSNYFKTLENAVVKDSLI